MFGAAIASFVTATMVFVGSLQTTKPEQREVRHTDYGGPPIVTLSQLAHISDAIVVATAGDITYTPSEFFGIDTRYQMLPHEVLKGDSHASINLSWSVVSHGGRKEEAAFVKVIEYENGPTLTTGSKYVIFAVWSQELGAYLFAHGADSVFPLMPDDTIVPSGASQLARTTSGTTLAALRSALASNP